MKTQLIDCCRVCPYYDGSDKEFAECIHSDAPKGAYESIVSRSHFAPEPVEKWCPIKAKGHIRILRDSNDKIISKTELIVTNA